MKRTFPVFVYNLVITAICCPCLAEPTPYGYDYLGDDKINPEPKRKPNASVYLSRVGRNWFGQNSGFTLTNEQQHYTPKNDVPSPNRLGSDLYESSEGLILPNLLIGHNIYAPTKELSVTKNFNVPDWYEPNKLVMSKRQPRYANKRELLSNSLHGSDLNVQDSLYHILNEKKKELSLTRSNGQDSYETDIGLILSYVQQYETDKETSLSNNLSGDDWTELDGGMSWSNEPTEQIQCANKENLSSPKAVGHIRYRPNVDVYLPRRDENRQWDKPTKGNTLSISTEKSYYDVHEALNTKNLKKIEAYIVKVVRRHQEGIQLNNKFKDEMAFTFTMPISRFRSKQSNNEDRNENLNKGQTSQKHSRQKYLGNSKGRGKNKIYNNSQKLFKTEHSRDDYHKHGGYNAEKHYKGKGKNKKYDKNLKRFKLLNSRPNGQYQNHPRGFMQYVPNFQNNHNTFENNYYSFQNNVQNNHNQIVDGQYFWQSREPLANRQKQFWEEYGDGPIPEILIRRPDNWSKNNKRPNHYLK